MGSFIKSTWEGIKGYVKGTIVGAGIGMLAGAAIFGIIAAVAGAPVIAAAGVGAAVLGQGFALMGGTSGAITSVINSRQTEQSGDMQAVANAYYQRGADAQKAMQNGTGKQHQKSLEYSSPAQVGR